MAWGLNTWKLYQVPAASVSYHPRLAGARGFWTGRLKTLPVGGGAMAEFDLGTAGLWWLRPFAVVEV
jgi:hypothetical protein